MKFKLIILTMSLTFCASTFAANPDQAAINALQQQIASVQSEMKAALAAQQSQTQKAMSDMQTQVQTQIAHLQTELQQLQAQLTNEIKMIQAETMKARSGAPVVTATPGVTAPASTPTH